MLFLPFKTGNIPAILVTSETGQRIVTLLENGTNVQLEFAVGSKIIKSVQIKKSSVLFVSVSFIVLMIISLAWLVFYYIQRFRYAQARDRTQVSPHCDRWFNKVGLIVRAFPLKGLSHYVSPDYLVLGIFINSSFWLQKVDH